MEGDRVEIEKLKKWGCTPKKQVKKEEREPEREGNGVKKMAP